MERRGKCHVIMVAKFLDHNNRELKQGRRRRQRERQKRNMFTVVARVSRFFFLYLSKPSLHDCDMEHPNFTAPAWWSTWTRDNNFLSLFLNLDSVFSDSTRENFSNIWQIERNWQGTMKFKTMRIKIFCLLRSRNFAAMAPWRNDFSPLLCSIFNLLLFLTTC